MGMGQNMRASGMRIRLMVWEHTTVLTAVGLTANGMNPQCTAVASTNGPMAVSTKASTRRIRRMDLEFSLGPMVAATKASGLLVTSMASAGFAAKVEVPGSQSGVLANA